MSTLAGVLFISVIFIFIVSIVVYLVTNKSVTKYTFVGAGKCINGQQIYEYKSNVNSSVVQVTKPCVNQDVQFTWDSSIGKCQPVNPLKPCANGGKGTQTTTYRCVQAGSNQGLNNCVLTDSTGLLNTYSLGQLTQQTNNCIVDGCS